MCVTAAALVLSAGATFAQDEKPPASPDPRAENRAERQQLGILPDLRRSDDTLSTRAEAARIRRQLEGEPQIGLTARLERVDHSPNAALARARYEGVIQEARIARVLGSRADQREREELVALELRFNLDKTRAGQFDRSGVGLVKEKIDERYEHQIQKRQGVKEEALNQPKEDRPDRHKEDLDRDESFRQRLEERNAALRDQKDEKKDEKKADKDDKKADAKDEKKADKADAVKERADDRKDLRTEAKTDTSSDKKTP